MSQEQEVLEHRYKDAIKTIHLCMVMLSSHDYDAILRDAERAESIGPFLDPTLWGKKHEALREDINCIRAAMPLYKFGKKVVDDFAKKNGHRELSSEDSMDRAKNPKETP